MQRKIDDFNELDARVVAVAAGQRLQEMHDYAVQNGITFPLLADDDRSVIRSYGVYHWMGLAIHNLLFRLSKPGLYVFDKLGYPLVSQEDREAIRRQGLPHWLGVAGYDLAKSIARPASFVIDKQGTVRSAYIGTHQFDMINQAETIEQLKLLNR